jgi:UDP-glucose 4-epimerase
LTGNQLIDASKARRVLDWRPPYSLDEGLAETARWFRSGTRAPERNALERPVLHRAD